MCPKNRWNMETKRTDTIKFFDYGHSFITASGHPKNNPRFMVEAICTLTDEFGEVDTYYQAAPCKGEHTFAKEKLFEENSFDFLPIIHEKQVLVFRNWRFYNYDERVAYKKAYDSKVLWGDKHYFIKEVGTKELLNTPEKIVKATNDGLAMMCRIVLKGKDKRKAVIDFPIKTINTFMNQYQIDTGPILFPDLKGIYPCKIFTFNLSHVAFNSFDFADFIIEGLTELFGQYTVARYCRVITIDKPELYLYSV